VIFGMKSAPYSRPIKRLKKQSVNSLNIYSEFGVRPPKATSAVFFKRYFNEPIKNQE